MKLNYGDSAARLVSERVAAPVASLTVLKQTPAKRRVHGQVAHVQDSNTYWYFNENASVTGDDILAVTPNAGSGRWMRLPGLAMLRVPFYATTPDATILLTVPTGAIIRPIEFGVDVSRVFTGAAGRGIAFSSSNHPGHTGIAAFAGSMVATQLNNMFSPTAAATQMAFQMCPIASGTFDTYANRRTWMKPGDTIRCDVLTGNLGTGVADLLVACEILENAGN